MTTALNINLVHPNNPYNTGTRVGEEDVDNSSPNSNGKTEGSSEGNHTASLKNDAYGLLSKSPLFSATESNKSNDADILLTRLFTLRTEPEEFKKAIEIGVNLLEHKDADVREMAASHLASWARNRSFGKMISNLCADRLRQDHQLKCEIAQLANKPNKTEEENFELAKMNFRQQKETFRQHDKMMDFFALYGHNSDREPWYNNIKNKFNKLDQVWFDGPKAKYDPDIATNYCHSKAYPHEYFPNLNLDEDEDQLERAFKVKEASGLITFDEQKISFYKKDGEVVFIHDKKFSKEMRRNLNDLISGFDEDHKLKITYKQTKKEIVNQVAFKIANCRNEEKFEEKYSTKMELKYRRRIKKLGKQINNLENGNKVKRYFSDYHAKKELKDKLEAKLTWDTVPIETAIFHLFPNGMVKGDKNKLAERIKNHDDSFMNANREIRKIKLDGDEVDSQNQIDNADDDDENGDPIVSSLDSTSKSGEIYPEALQVNEQINSSN